MSASPVMERGVAPSGAGDTGRAGAGHPLTGTWRLARAMLRADRVRLTVWLAVIVGFIAYVAVAFPAAMGDVAVAERGAVMAEPAAAMMAGPGYGLENYTLEVMMANEMLGLFAVLVAIMSLQLVTRHTRAEEEAGRTDLVRAAPVGRHAQLTAAVVVLIAANLVVGAGTAGALVIAGLEPALDSTVFGLALAAVGVVFGALAATTAQLNRSARAAAGMAGAALGVAYVLRAVGDASQRGGNWMSWLSPIGWAQQMRIYVDLRWEPMLLLGGLAVLALGLAYALSARRDVDGALLPERLGRARATAAGRTLAGLTVRLEAPRVLWWGLGLGVFGVLTGSLAGPMADMLADNPQLAQMMGLTGEAADDFIAETMSVFLMFFAMAVAAYAVMSTRSLRADEATGRSELALAGAVSRHRWLGLPLIVTVAAGILLLAVSGLGLGAGAAAELGADALGDFTLAALTYAPLIAGWAAAAALFYGLRGGGGWLWALLGICLVVGMYGSMLGLPDAVIDAEPFSMVEPMTLIRGDAEWESDSPWWPLVGASAVAVVLAAAALGAFRRRDAA